MRHVRPRGAAFVVSALLLSAILVGGCTSYPAGEAVLPGMSRNDVLTRLGSPDVVGETSGDQGRYYRPEQPPDWEWPKTKTTVYYYLERDLEVVIERERVISLSRIEPERMPLLRQVVRP